MSRLPSAPELAEFRARLAEIRASAVRAGEHARWAWPLALDPLHSPRLETGGSGSGTGDPTGETAAARERAVRLLARAWSDVQAAEKAIRSAERTLRGLVGAGAAPGGMKPVAREVQVATKADIEAARAAQVRRRGRGEDYGVA